MDKTYRSKDVKEALTGMLAGVTGNVYTNSRPTAVPETMDMFIVIRMPQGEILESQIHSIADVQMHCFVKDRQGGITNEDKMDEMVDGVSRLFPFSTELMRCNEKPRLLSVKSDGMGYHATILQFRVIILV